MPDNKTTGEQVINDATKKDVESTDTSEGENFFAQGESGDPVIETKAGKDTTVVPETPEGIKPSYTQDALDQAMRKKGVEMSNVESEYTRTMENIRKNAMDANVLDAMSKYTSNQQADRFGWADNAKLDSDRQVEYLRASIAADVYGQLELQKLGLESALTQARMAFESNKVELAMEYYNQAYERAVHESNVTGYWIDPTVRDMLTQLQAAETELASDNVALHPHAQRVSEKINTWFEENNGLTKEGVKTLAKLNMVKQHEYNEAQIQELIEQTRLARVSTELSLQQREQDMKDQGMIVTGTNDDGVPEGFNPLTDNTKAIEWFNNTELGEQRFNSFVTQVETNMQQQFRLANQEGQYASYQEFLEEAGGGILGDFVRENHDKIDHLGDMYKEEVNENGDITGYIKMNDMEIVVDVQISEKTIKEAEAKDKEVAELVDNNQFQTAIQGNDIKLNNISSWMNSSTEKANIWATGTGELSVIDKNGKKYRLQASKGFFGRKSAPKDPEALTAIATETSGRNTPRADQIVGYDGGMYIYIGVTKEWRKLHPRPYVPYSKDYDSLLNTLDLE